MTHSAIRIGAVNYLNTKPLIEDLELLAPEAELVLQVPSRLADDLAAGRLDVALIPVIEYFRGAGAYGIVPNIAIASDGPVLSVTLFSRVPWMRVRARARRWRRYSFANVTGSRRRSCRCPWRTRPNTRMPTRFC